MNLIKVHLLHLTFTILKKPLVSHLFFRKLLETSADLVRTYDYKINSKLLRNMLIDSLQFEFVKTNLIN